MRPLPPGVTDPTPTRVDIPLPIRDGVMIDPSAVPAVLRTPTDGRAVLRQTLYCLTRPVGDLAAGVMVAPLSEAIDPTTAPSTYVEDGAERGAYVRHGDVQRVTGLAVLVDHVDGYSSAFPHVVDEARARAFASACLTLPTVAGAWVGEVIRQH